MDRKPESDQQPRAPAEPANISPPKWGKEGSFVLLLLRLLVCSCFMSAFVFLGRIFAVMTHSGLKVGVCFQLPFALKGDVASGICQV